jgi:hypothetical protein
MMEFNTGACELSPVVSLCVCIELILYVAQAPPKQAPESTPENSAHLLVLHASHDQ